MIGIDCRAAGIFVVLAMFSLSTVAQVVPGEAAPKPADGAKSPIACTWVFAALSGGSVLQIRDDGTYLNHGAGFKYSGKWNKNADGTYTIKGGDNGAEDWTITLQPDNQSISVTKASIFTTKTARRSADDSRIVQNDKTDPEFFLGTWNLKSHGSAMTVPIGSIAINKDGTIDRTGPDGAKSTGSWKAADKFDGIVVTLGEKTFQVMQLFADNQGLYMACEGVRYQGFRPRKD